MNWFEEKKQGTTGNSKKGAAGVRGNLCCCGAKTTLARGKRVRLSGEKSVEIMYWQGGNPHEAKRKKKKKKKKIKNTVTTSGGKR